MKSFKEYINEMVDSNIEVHKNPEVANSINQYLGDKVYPGHTAVFHTDHMLKNNNYVLRFMNKNNEVEYHFGDSSGGDYFDHKLDNKSMLHALQIIHNDSKSYLARGNNIKLQSRTAKQSNNYKNFIKASLKRNGFNDKKVVDKGITPTIDGIHSGHTIMVQNESYNLIQWNKIIFE